MKEYRILLALQSMFGPAYVLRHYKVLVALHPRSTTLGSGGVSVVADIDPINPGVSPVRAGQAGSIRQGQGRNGEGDNGVHLSCSKVSVTMINTQLCCLLYPVTVYFYEDNTIAIPIIIFTLKYVLMYLRLLKKLYCHRFLLLSHLYVSGFE